MKNDFSDEINAQILLQNNSPIEDFLGLTASQMHHLLYDTYGENSPVQLNNNIDEKTLDQIPIFRIAEEYLKIIQRDKHIKLTPLGALPRKVIYELYNKRFLLEDLIESGITKVGREEDFRAITSARLTMELAGLVKKTNGKLTLTKKASNILATNDRRQLFSLFIQTFTNKFAWSYNDGYTEEPVGQFGWAFSIILLNKFGNNPATANIYAKKYAQAFPMFLRFFQPIHDTTNRYFTRCYTLRTFERFLLWFGFITVSRQKNFSNTDTDKYQQTEIMKDVFQIHCNNLQ